MAPAPAGSPSPVQPASTSPRPGHRVVVPAQPPQSSRMCQQRGQTSEQSPRWLQQMPYRANRKRGQNDHPESALWQGEQPGTASADQAPASPAQSWYCRAIQSVAHYGPNQARQSTPFPEEGIQQENHGKGAGHLRTAAHRERSLHQDNDAQA